jgi:hypothetical protein
MIPQASRPLWSAERLVQLTSWCVAPHGLLEHFIDKLVEARTNVPLQVQGPAQKPYDFAVEL